MKTARCLKKSEFYSAILEGQDSLRDLAEKLEASGYQFEPEEEPLPEKLQVSPYAPLDTGYIESDGVYWLCINNPRVNTLMGLTTAEQRLALAREMVRRYNAWPELERLALELEEERLILGGGARIAARALRKILESGKP